MPLLLLILSLILLALPIAAPRIDLWASSLFYEQGAGFVWADLWPLQALHWLANGGSRLLGGVLVVAMLLSLWRKKALAGLDAKAWGFLFAALLIGPGLVANVGLKDHWGRYRPREVTEFGGAQIFTPALEPHFENAHSNGSFVAGDAAFGFFLTAVAYVVPRRTSRRTFWSMVAFGGLFGFARLAMGAHFLCDVIYAAYTMLAAGAGVHAAFYGRQETSSRWRSWLGVK